MIQLREKIWTTRRLPGRGRGRWWPLCHRYGVPCLINDNLPVALAAGADRVHVGQEDQPVAAIRRQVGPDFLIGATAKTLDQAPGCPGRRGGLPGGLGPASPPTKPNAKGITREALADICAAVPPGGGHWGESPSRMPGSSRGVGMAGLAVISALFAAPDITTAARDLLALSRHLTEGGAP